MTRSRLHEIWVCMPSADAHPETHRHHCSENAATYCPDRTQISAANEKLFLFVPIVPILEVRKSLRGMVPRDGVEPPTPAFSGLRSSAAFPLKHLDLVVFLASKNTRILEPNGTTQFTMCDPGSVVSLSTT